MTPAELHDYIFTDLGFCGCGTPEAVLTFLRDILQAVDSRSEIGTDSTLNHGGEAMRQLVWYFLDDKELTEHGSRADMGWLTDKGKEVLVALKSADIEKLCEAEHVDDPPRRLMSVPVTVELLIEMIREGYRGGAECTQGIPADAVLVSSRVKTEPNGSQAAHLIFEHESFPLVEPGAEIPTKQIIFFRVRLEGESKLDQVSDYLLGREQ